MTAGLPSFRGFFQKLPAPYGGLFFWEVHSHAPGHGNPDSWHYQIILDKTAQRVKGVSFL
jgi:hypothetical protein